VFVLLDSNVWLAALAAKTLIREEVAVVLSGRFDPDDQPIIAAAVAYGCRFFVTGDKELLNLKSISGVEIVSVRETRPRPNTSPPGWPPAFPPASKISSQSVRSRSSAKIARPGCRAPSRDTSPRHIPCVFCLPSPRPSCLPHAMPRILPVCRPLYRHTVANCLKHSDIYNSRD
jgi:hypothetical protein